MSSSGDMAIEARRTAWGAFFQSGRAYRTEGRMAIVARPGKARVQRGAGMATFAFMCFIGLRAAPAIFHSTATAATLFHRKELQ